MGVDTKGFIVTPCKDVLLLSNLAGQALKHLVQSECRLHFPEAALRRSDAARSQFRHPSFDLKPDLAMLTMNFVFRGENRSMNMMFLCDMDRKEYGPQSISVSMGCFGHSELFLKTVLHALSVVGPAWYDHNDSDSIDFAPLEEKAPTLLGAISLGYVRSSSIAQWVNWFDAGVVGRGLPFEDFFGAPEATLRGYVGMKDSVGCWNLTDALAKQRDETPSFLSDYHREALAEPA